MTPMMHGRILVHHCGLKLKWTIDILQSCQLQSLPPKNIWDVKLFCQCIEVSSFCPHICVMMFMCF